MRYYFHQDVEIDEKGVIDFVNSNNVEYIIFVLEAIDEFIESNEFDENFKREYISDLNCYRSFPNEAYEWLEKIKKLIKYYVNHKNN